MSHRLLPHLRDTIEEPAVSDTQRRLEQEAAALEAKEQADRQAVLAGVAPDPDPIDMRGIPAIGRGVTGTSPGEGDTATLMSQRPGATL